MSTPRKTPRRPAPPSTTEMLGVQYTRYSMEHQGSTPEQMAINEELAADEAIRLVAHFKDEGGSRSIDERPWFTWRPYRQSAAQSQVARTASLLLFDVEAAANPRRVMLIEGRSPKLPQDFVDRHRHERDCAPRAMGL